MSSTRKSKGKWRRRALLGLAAVLALPALALAAAKTSWARDRARALVVEVLRDELGLVARLGDVELQVLPPTVIATDLEVRHPTAGKLASAAELRIRPSLWALVRGGVDLESVELVRPDVRLVLAEGALVNGPRLPETGSGGGDLPLRDLAVDDATVSVETDLGVSGTIRGLDVDASIGGGDVTDLRLRSTSGELLHEGGAESLTEVDLRARITPAYVLVHSLTVRTPHADVGARRLSLPAPFGASASGHLEIGLQLDRLAALPLPVRLPPLTGRVSASLEARYARAATAGADPDVQAEGRIVLDGVRIDGRGIGARADLDVEANRDRVRVRSGTVDVVHQGGRARLTAEVGLRGKFPITAHVDVDRLQFAKLMDQLDVGPDAIVQWLVDAQLDVRGTLMPLSIVGPIRTQTREFLVSTGPYHRAPVERVISVGPSRIDGVFRVRPDAIRFESLVAQTPRSRLSGSVHLGFRDYFEVDVTSEHLDLGDVTPLLRFPIAGVGRATARVRGTYSDPQVRGHVAMRGFSFDGKPAGDLESEWQLERGGFAVRFPRVQATKGGSQYHAEDLYLDFSDDRFLLTTNVHMEALALADFYAMLDYEGDERFTPYQGLAIGTAGVRFTRGFPGDLPAGTLVVDVDVRLPTVTLNGFAFEDGVLAARYRWVDWTRGYLGAEIDVHHVELDKGEGRLVAQGRMGLGGTLAFDAFVDRFSLRDLEGVGDRFPDLDGVVGAVARVSGTMSAMRLDADVAVTGLAWKGRPLGDARTYVRMTDPRDPWIREALAWDRAAPPPGEPCARGRMGLAHGRWPEDPPLRTRDGSIPALDQPMAFVVCGEGLRGKLAFDLAIGRTKVYPLRGRIALEDFDLGPLLPQRGLRGALSAVVDVTGGAMRSDDWLTAEVRVGKLRVGAGDVEIRNDGELRLSLDRGRYAIGRARLIGPSSRLEVSGGGTASTVAARVSGEVDLALLASLSEFVTEAQGLVRLEVRVSGPLASPEAYGTAVIDDATLRSVVLPEPIEGLTGRVTFSQRVVNIENVSARVAGGSVAASGTGILEGRGLAAFDVDVSARDLAMHPADGVELGIGGDARLSWRRGDRVPSLSGVLHVGRLVYTRPIQVGQTLDELSRRARTEVARYDPALDHLQFDLRVVADAPLHVANNLLEADLSIRDAERPFRVVGTDQRFGVLGTMGIDRGVVRFRSTTFDIQRGVLEFDDETRIDPRFDIRAQTTIRRSGDFNVPLWRILLRAYGTTDGFRLDTQSDPELSQEDIVLLLTMGMTRAEAQQLQGGSLGQAAALEALTTVSGVDREVRNAVRVIDDFRLSSGYSLRTQRSEPQVSVGKRISDRVRLSATTGLGEARDFRASVEWQLDDQTSVQGGYDNLNTTTNATLGNLGVDLRWRLEFE